MNKIFAGLVAAIVFSAGVAAAADAPPTLTFEAKQGKVTFGHKAHQDLLKGDCLKCHADKAGGKIAGFNKEKAHALCQGCHKEGHKGPTKCTECHKK
jgi:predicted CXXCH cytochrome family protein